ALPRGAPTRHGSAIASSPTANASSTARMLVPLPHPVLDHPRAPLRPDVAGPGREHSPELLLDEARDRGALRKAVVPSDGLQHVEVLVGGGVAAYLILSRHGGCARLLYRL